MSAPLSPAELEPELKAQAVSLIGSMGQVLCQLWTEHVF